MISIIVPCYNAADTIGQTLNAIRHQTYNDYEVIAVNDGSQDNTLEILREWAATDDRIKIIHQCNQGVSAARNSAITQAKGDYICFVDSDDIIEEDYLEQLLGLISINDSYDLAMCGFTTSMCISKVRNYSRAHLDCMEFIRKTIVDKTLNPQIWCMLYRTDIIKHNKIMFEVGCTRGEDREFFFKYILHAKSIVYTSDKLYHYRVSSTSAMAKLNEKSLTSIDASLRTYIYYKKYNHSMANVLLYSYYCSIWKFVILCNMRNNCSLLSILKERYDVREAMEYLLSNNNGSISIRISSFIYLMAPYIFRKLCRLGGLVVKTR